MISEKLLFIKSWGIAPGNADEYDANIAPEVDNPIGKRAIEDMDLEGWQKNLDEFLAEKGFKK